MGGSKKVTVGYKYYLGMHQVLCHGPIDTIKRITVDKKIAWEGHHTSGPLHVDKEGLFGGESKEGGVSGNLDFDMGKPNQNQNLYLQSQLGADIPAFRGVVSAIFKKVYLGMNPYLKPWAFRAQRVYIKDDGEEQWYSGKAGIGDYDSLALYMTVDTSGSMGDLTSNGLSRLQNVKDALISLLNSMKPLVRVGLNIDMKFVEWADSDNTSTSYYNVSEDDIDDLITFVSSWSAVGGTNFEAGVQSAPTFFSGSTKDEKILIFMTDGAPSPTSSATDAKTIIDNLTDVKSYAFNIDLADTTYTSLVDNTLSDGVPVVEGGGNAILNIITQALAKQIDMNCSHICREVLTNKKWGDGEPEITLDEDAFLAMADTCYQEGLGLSLLWDKQMTSGEFISEVMRHANGVIRIDKSTGKYYPKLIRNDYDPEDLLVFDESNISKVTAYSRQALNSDTINTVTVKFWDYRTGEMASVHSDNLGMIQAQGKVVGTTVQYPGVTRRSLAQRFAERDLKMFSAPLLKATILTKRLGASIQIGDVFKFAWPKYHSGYIIMRALEVSYGTHSTNVVKIKAIEDVFALPDTTSIVGEESGFTSITSEPVESDTRIVIETPYYEIVQTLGQTEADSKLTDNSDIGYIGTAAVSPTGGSLNYILTVDSGAGFVDSAVGDFCPAVIVSSAITDKLQTVIPYSSGTDLENVELDTLAYWDDEIVRIDSIDTGTNEITIGRGCLDTIPQTHLSGSAIVLWDVFVTTDEVEYVASDSVDVKIRPATGLGALALADATTDNVVMNSRAIRPYRPTQVKADGEYEPDLNATPSYPITISWVERNRTQETAGGVLAWDDAGVTVEAGVTYTIRVYGVEADETTEVGVALEVTGVTGTSYDIEVGDFTAHTEQPYMRAYVYAVKDGYESWTASSVLFRGVFGPPFNLQSSYIE